MNLRPIQLEVQKSVVEKFKRAAKEAFPLETFAYLLGRDAGTSVEIEDIFIPNNVLECVTTTSVLIDDSWLPAARKEARDLGLTVVGDIHSHPFRYGEEGDLRLHSAPSAIDMENGLKGINGICAVVQSKSGRLRSRVTFWGPMCEVRERLIK